MSGVVVDPAAPDYDEVRKVWNADIDLRPAAVARCASTEDVVAAVNFGRDNGLEIAVRGGAHSPAGQSAVDDGLVIDLRAMNRVVVDPEARRARVQGVRCWPTSLSSPTERSRCSPSALRRRRCWTAWAR
jgi:hypothetical protein